ncbi:hypothetical protein AB0I72_19245 [Nocardiopsis sp. NPDC049922]|uniref:hypothetical protein n=1 Tax=Nocardiopsis sp. NPDC049922 TaxID=3155157 RepID=UPI0033E2EA6A
MSLPEVVSTGDRQASLEALRNELARRLPRASDREAAPLATQLRLVLAELDAMKSGEAGDVVDDLAARRAARRADASDQGGATGSE